MSIYDKIKKARYDVKENGPINNLDLLAYEADNYKDNKFALLLNDLQANILKSHGQEKSLLIFFDFDRRKNMRPAIKDWFSKLKITSAQEQFEKFSPGHSGENPVLINEVFQKSTIKCFYLSRKGYQFIYTDSPIKDAMEKTWSKSSFNENGLNKLLQKLIGIKFLKTQKRKEKRKEVFYTHKKNQTKSIGKSASTENFQKMMDEVEKIEEEIKNLNKKIKWIKNRIENFGNDNEFDAMLLIAGNKKSIDVEKQIAIVEEIGTNLKVIEGKNNPDGDGQESMEWFGFKDGISNPRFFPGEKAKLYSADKYEKPAQLNTVLHPCLSSSVDAFGSFLAFIKIKQNKDVFEAHCEAIAKNLYVNKGADIEENWKNLPYNEKERRRELAAALILGIHKDGTPLTLSEHQDPDAHLKFNYRNDKLGLKCPFHSHIRNVNPRDGDEFRRIVRRGMIYGENKEGAEKGILFMSFQNSLREQFEYIMERYVFNKNYRTRPKGTDALLDSDPKYKVYTTVWGDGNVRKFSIAKEVKDLDPIVEFEWGQYFFAPSISYINREIPKLL